MEFKRKRGSLLIIFESVPKILLLVVATILSIVMLKNLDWELLIGVIVLAAEPFFVIIKNQTTYYTVEDDNIVVEGGIFKKFTQHLPFEKITTVDLSQNFVMRVLGIYKIKINNSSAGDAGSAEVVLALKESEALEFKSIVSKGLTNSVDNEACEKDLSENTVNVSPMEFIKLGLLRSKIGGMIVIAQLIVLAAGVVLFFIYGEVTDNVLEKALSSIFSSETFEIEITALPIILILAGLYCLSAIYSAVSLAIKYYGFNVCRDGDSLLLEYGLFSRSKYTLKREKISAVKLNQNLLMRIFRVYSAEVVLIGFGQDEDDKDQFKKVIYPVANKKVIEDFLKNVLPEFSFPPEIKKAPIRALRYYFYSFAVVFFLAGIVISVVNRFLPGVLAFAFLLVMCCISKVLQFFNSGLYEDEKNITGVCGGFHKETVIMNRDRVESVSERAGFVKRKRGFATITVWLLADKLSKEIKVRNMPMTEYKALVDSLKY